MTGLFFRESEFESPLERKTYIGHTKKIFCTWAFYSCKSPKYLWVEVGLVQKHSPTKEDLKLQGVQFSWNELSIHHLDISRHEFMITSEQNSSRARDSAQVHLTAHLKTYSQASDSITFSENPPYLYTQLLLFRSVLLIYSLKQTVMKRCALGFPDKISPAKDRCHPLANGKESGKNIQVDNSCISCWLSLVDLEELCVC